MPSCQLEALRPAHQFAAKNCGARASHVYKSRQSFFCSVGQFQLFTGFQVSNVVHTNEKMKSPNYSTFGINAVRTTAGTVRLLQNGSSVQYSKYSRAS